MIEIRAYQNGDFAGIVAVYREAVETIGAQFYEPDQVAVWSQYADETEDFRGRIEAGGALVATEGKEIIAFAQLWPGDHLAFLYCRSSHARRGLATRLYLQLEEAAKSGGAIFLSTDASRASRPFFEGQGFRVLGREEVERKGVLMERFRMGKLLWQPEARRWVIFGNSGSGKSTLARKITELIGGRSLDLDTIAWNPKADTPVRQDLAVSFAEVDRVVGDTDIWVIEGCYEDLIDHALQWNPAMVFLNPGPEVCLEHARSRPFEAHKFATPEAQAKALEFLLDWISKYPDRSGSMSLARHRELFESYSGPKCELPEKTKCQPLKAIAANREVYATPWRRPTSHRNPR